MSTTSVEPDGTTSHTTSHITSRRTVLRAAAWTAPAVSVAVAVPAYAACSQPAVAGAIDWDAPSGVRFSVANDRRSASATYTRAGAAPLVVTMSTNYVNSMQVGSREGGNQNFTRPWRIGGLPIGGLAMHQYNTRKNPRPEKDRRTDRGEYAFVFSRPVTNLSFYLTDIDAAAGDFRDAVELTSGFAQLERASRVDGAGTQGTPYKSNTAGTLQDNAFGGGGNVRVQYAGPVSAFTITYWNIQDAFDKDTDTDQQTFISDLSFQYSPLEGCGPLG
jgi:hypothetical protein